MFSRQFEELRLTGCLPSPTGVGLAVLRSAQTENFVMAELVDAIRADAALTGMILKLVNSEGETPVTTVGAAVLRLGVMTVRKTALAFTLISGNRTGVCTSFDYSGFWASSLATALAARAVAPLLGRHGLVDPEEAYTCALLAQMGRLALASIHPQTYARLIDESKDLAAEEVLALERRTLDVDHRELTGAMFEDWKLPTHWIHAAMLGEQPDGAEHAPDDETRAMLLVLRAARRFALACVSPKDMSPSDWKQRWRDLEQLRGDLGLEAAGFNDLCKSLAEQWRTRSRLLDVATDATLSLEGTARRLEREPVQRQRAAGERERAGLYILAVDDDPLSLRLLTHHLTRDGHRVDTAKDGRQALAMALNDKYQMVVTDWMMPEMDGIELCKALRSSGEGSGTYILLVTGREDEDRVIEAFDAGADEYLTKPFNPRILVARVRAGQRMIELREQAESDKQQRSQQVNQIMVLNRKLRTAANTDVLTALWNRRYGIKRLFTELRLALEGQTPLSVIMIDIDHFKQVNDKHGHDVGDVVLAETAEVLRRSTRRGEVVCRLGGEEFLVICIGASAEECAKTAERIRLAIERKVIHHDTFRRNVTASLGVSSLSPSVQSVDDLLLAADRGLYKAKAAGRNRVVVDDESPPALSKSA
jgi:diguanylate cyclase (GGDEF)-like protein